MQHAAVVDARHVLDPMFHSRQELSDTAETARHRHIDCDHGSTLGDSVALQHADAELLDPQSADLLRESFGAGYDVPQAAEIVWMRMFAVVGKKG